MSSTAPDSQVSLLAGALVDANDQLLALYELASITADSLDEGEVVTRILLRAQKLLQTDALILNTATPYSVGEPSAIDDLATAQHSDFAGQSVVASSTCTLDTGQQITVSALRRESEFGTADNKLLDAVATMLAGAVNTARLHEVAVTQAVMASDHETASQLAQSALPRWLPNLPGADLFARSEPARSAGGDLYCYEVIDGVLHFAVGDVSGKGLPAALMMTNVISASKAAFHRHSSEGSAAMLRAVDLWVHRSLSDAGMFVTLLLGSFDPASRELQLSNAGHSPVFLERNGVLEPRLAHHPPVGVLPIDEPEQSSEILASGDRLVVASDGITEQMGNDGGMFGDDRLHDLIDANPKMSAAELGALLFDRVEMFAGTAPQGDDRTLFIVNAVPEESNE